MGEYIQYIFFYVPISSNSKTKNQQQVFSQLSKRWEKIEYAKILKIRMYIDLEKNNNVHS